MLLEPVLGDEGRATLMSTVDAAGVSNGDECVKPALAARCVHVLVIIDA
jgi:hypothetical protein